jgi:hypothetical protein
MFEDNVMMIAEMVVYRYHFQAADSIGNICPVTMQFMAEVD